MDLNVKLRFKSAKCFEVKTFIHMFYLLAVICSYLSSNKVLALDAVSTAPLENQIKIESPYSLSLSASYNAGFREDIDNYNVYSLSAGYKFSQNTSFSVAQRWTHLSYVYQNESEIQAWDTSIKYNRKLDWELIKDQKLNLSFGATLPTSESSTRNSVYSKPSVKISQSGSLINDRLTYSGYLNGVYYLNKYKTTLTGEGRGGGNPLRQYFLGGGLNLSYSATEKMSFYVDGGYSQVTYEVVSNENQFEKRSMANPPVHRWTYSMGGSYQLLTQLSLSLDYGYDSQIEKMGGIELVAYDEMTSEWSLSASYTF